MDSHKKNKNFYIDREDLIILFQKINETISKVEVRGDSVSFLYDTRLLINELASSIKERSE